MFIFFRKPKINYGKAVAHFDLKKRTVRLFHIPSGIVVEAKGWRAKSRAERQLMDKLSGH